VHAPDLRGHGDSERSGPYTADQLAADLEAFLDALGLRRVALVAHSASAVPAYLFAARFPDRVTRLVLEEPVPPVPLPRAEMDLPAEPPFDPDALALVDELADPPAAWRDALRELKVPVLLIAGGPASPLGQDMLAEMAAMIPDCTLVTIDGGHHVHSAAPAEFAAAVTAFLSAG
jgi:pimeloyl-ACP methyl ester carboxylesterase